MRKLPWGIIFLVIWGLFLTTSVTLYLKFFQPAKLGYTVSSTIESNLQLSSDIEFIKLQFFPNPAIIMKDVALTRDEDNIEIKFAEAHAHLSWKTLLVGRPVIRSIDIFNPIVKLVAPETISQKQINILQTKNSTNNKTQDNAALKKAKHDILEQNVNLILEKFIQLEMPYFIADASLQLRNGALEVKLPQINGTLNLDNININLLAPGIISGHLDLRIEETKLIAKNIPDLQLNRTSLVLTGWRLDTDSVQADMHLQSQFQMGSLKKVRKTPIKKAYRYFPMPEPARFSIRKNFEYDKQEKIFDAEGLLQARLLLPMNGHNTPIELDLPFSFTGTSQNNKKNMREIPQKTPETASFINAFLENNNNLPHKAVQLPSFYVDTITITNAYLKMDSDSINTSGELLGLYPPSPFFQGKAKIHNFSLPRWIGATRKMSGGLINALNNISGELTFIVNKRGVYASRIKGKVKDIVVEGIGSCGHFLEPDVAIKIKPTREMIQKGAINANLLFPEINGIDVKKVKLPPAAVPARTKDDTSPEIFVDYHIDITVPHADIWKVSAKKIHTLISPNKEETPTIKVSVGDLYQGTVSSYTILNDGNNHIQASLQNVNLEEPVRRIVGFTAVRGLLSTEANINLSGDSIEQILSSLEVEANGEIRNGSFHSEESILHDFKSTSYDVNVKTIPFYIKNVKLPNLFQVKGDYAITTKHKNLDSKFTTNAIIDFSTSNGLPLRMNLQSAEIQHFTSGENNLENFFVKGKGLLGYDFTKDEYLTIKEFKGIFNDDTVTGSYNIHKKEQLDWSGKIHFDNINLDEYLFDEEPDDPITDKKTKQETSLPLPIHFLSNNSINYEITAKEATLLGTTLQNLSSKITLNNGNLIIEKTGGTVKGGGNIQAFLEAKTTAHLPSQKGNIQSKFKFQLDNADMLAITKMREHDTLMAGNALIQLAGDGIFQTSADILSKLNGTWNINIQNGYILNSKTKIPTPKEEELSSHTPLISVSTTKDTTKDTTKGGKTYFNNLLASGTIDNGLVSNPKFVISSSTLSVIGNGTVDLPSKQINANAILTYRGVSEVPISITGTINNPITSVKVLGAVAGTLGNIGSGFFETIGNILSSPIYLFTQERTISTP